MAESTIIELTDAPADLLDVETPSEISSAPSSALPALSHRSRPRSTSSSFIGYSFRHDGKEYQIRERSAVRKGGKQSYIWQHGSELKCKQNIYPSWLCNICWDRGRTEALSASNTHRSIAHLRKQHRIIGEGSVEEIDERQDRPESAKRSVLALQI